MLHEAAYNRTIKVQCGTKSGSGFLYDHNGRTYIITAAHLLTELNETVQVTSIRSSGMVVVDVTVVGIGDTENDIAVLRANGNIAWHNSDNVPFSDNGCIVGQDVYFAGYPFGEYGRGAGVSFMAFVKRACLSAVDIHSYKFRRWYLDGINNEGFSGGPVLFRKAMSNDNGLYIGAIIGGYRINKAKIKTDDGIDLAYVHEENTGIIKSTSFLHALEWIQRDPTG